MSNTIKVSQLYDQVVDQFNIPASALVEEHQDVIKHLKSLTKQDLERIELHVRRLHDQNRKSKSPIIEVLTLKSHKDLELDVGGFDCIPIHFVHLREDF